jgi:hypothetical protein
MGGLMLSFGILISLISRGILEADTAHEILNEQISVLEDLQSHGGTGVGARAQIASGLTDLLYLKKQLQLFPQTRLAD